MTRRVAFAAALRKKLAASGAGRWRTQMAAMVIVTASVGLFSSYVLLHLGVRQMWLRYPAAVGLAYAALLIQIWMWIAWHRRRRERSGSDLDADWSNALDAVDGIGAGDAPAGMHPGGGGFGGGGASSQFGASPPAMPSDSESSGIGDLGVADADEIAVVLLSVAFALSAILATGYLVWTAPALFADLMVDGVLAAGLYRRLKHSGEPTWVPQTLRRTWGPALAVALTALVVGIGFHVVAPKADSIGDVWNQVFGDGDGSSSRASGAEPHQGATSE